MLINGCSTVAPIFTVAPVFRSASIKLAWSSLFHPGWQRNEQSLEQFIAYLEARAAWIPNYRQRRIERKYIGSGHAEKANDLIVARGQKGRGMHWSQHTSDGLAALRTLMLNGGWDRYWQQREVLLLMAS